MRFLGAVALALAACVDQVVVLQGTPTPAPVPLPVVELKYRVFEQVGRPWYCDPDLYPIARADERELARQRLPEMQRDADTYAAILRHTGLAAGAALTDDQLLAVYHDWKDLRALDLRLVSGGQGAYGVFTLFRAAAASKQGERIDLRISEAGRITIIHRETAGPPNCPICLADTTVIDTPSGSVRVTDLAVGDVVWTLSVAGERIAAPILETGSMPAPAGHEMLRVVLADGRAVTASPGHPTADGRALGALRVGDRLDGASVVAIERLPYRGRTYDLLPAGATGAYWADGVLLESTLGQPKRAIPTPPITAPASFLIGK